jgi:D-beta-D-heptose 7-phosphate kinase/D-beta-D-heptose 1-phosphate adenosyltransferase
VSGAGDTVSAVFTLSLAVGATPEESATLANCAAARVIREVGTATLDPEELKEVVEFWGQQE